MTKHSDLINKYNVPGPRYTSYPTVPHWKSDDNFPEKWPSLVKSFYSENREDGISIYIHLPFCESLCTFCGCHKHITKRHELELPYLAALKSEWKSYLEILGEKPLLKELHIGGGTPTFFSPKNLVNFLSYLLDTCELDENVELGFEGHPNNTSFQHLLGLAQLGFSRVSYGVQDYAEEVQKVINRIQPFENVKQAHLNAQAAGYTSISHDLVFGLPKQTLAHLNRSIELTLQLRPDRISLYSYAHVPWVPGSGQRAYDESDLPSPQVKRQLYESAKARLLHEGFVEVGMDHFALPTDKLAIALKNKSLHRNFMGYTTNNTKIMIGLGMSAISDVWGAFGQNIKSVNAYQDAANSGSIPVFRGHEHSQEDLELRQIILDIICHFEAAWTPEFESTSRFNEIKNELESLIEDDLCVLQAGGIKVTERGEAFVRNICMCFDAHLKQDQVKRFSKTI
jgi:oxygen-independent coproporphyrinogen-3 oxidase